MRRNRPLPELLAPAGGESAFYAALSAGADAIYVGGELFNARALSENFTESALQRCVALAHARGVRVYVTLNTLLADVELEEGLRYAVKLWNTGADALICADVGLALLIRRHAPSIVLHASTQMSLHSTGGAEEMADLGYTQVVPARELSLADITSLVEHARQEVEVFLHGALCVSYSGQCLFSSLVGGRSGNRGTCAQPCRLPYNGGYPLSLKDLSLADHVTELIESGVSSLKIEGRMKRPEYVYGVTRIYRRLLDERRNATKEEKRALEAIFARSGFTDGYFTDKIEQPMTGVRRPEDKVSSKENANFNIPNLDKVPLSGVCTIRRGCPVTLTLTDPFGKTVTVTGDTPSPAISHPLDAEGVRARLIKTGNTPYVLSADDLLVEVDPGLNVSPAALNAVRRKAVDALLGSRAPLTLSQDGIPRKRVFRSMGASSLFCNPSVWEGLTEEERGFFSLSFLPLWRLGEAVHLPHGVWLPPIITDTEEACVKEMLAAAKSKGITHALVGNPHQVKLAREAGMEIVGDFRLNITNGISAAYWQSHGVTDAILSPELTAPALRDIGGRVFAWGRIPLMLTERCFMRENGGCQKCGEVILKDRMGAMFPLMQVYPHRNQILNSIPTYLGDLKEGLPPGTAPHFLFTVETLQEVREVLVSYRKKAALPYPVRRLPKEKF